jgi:chemotaxis signal transduction protein
MSSSEASLTPPSQRQADAGTIQVVSVRLANEEYGIEIANVREIILVGKIARAPQTSPLRHVSIRG